MVSLPKVAVAMVHFHIDHVIVQLFFQAQAKFLNALGDQRRAADERGTGQALIDHDLRGTQNALFFTLAKGHAFFQGPLGGGKNRPHGVA